MGCRCSKTIPIATDKSKEVQDKKSLSAEKPKYIEYTEDIQNIRRAAKNMCLLSNYTWHIESIKKDWDITVKDYSYFDFSGTSVKDSKKYLDIRFQQSIELQQNACDILFPVNNDNKDTIGDDKSLDKSYYSFKLALVIGSDNSNGSTTKKQKAHRKCESISCESLFIVAAEQKGTECKLIVYHALINISAFRRSIGLPPIVHKQQNNDEDLMYDLSYGLDGECST